ncbi:uncharacterized protein N7443_002751 [Penicillium atrosanguineum]|uniref:uncharacterized protein n=1 Tax=Penicillium atrosanguineum TaxID=1132637 RepID=UPI00239399CC|nr:uncharacterized protein N7443_002751 [Penicillium atrosanguineum]KAJ5310290.1 hypothetical protein N7443_002751 [Penicillium atrosanguineum]
MDIFSIMVLRQRPDIHAPILDVSTNNEQSVTPGFIFLAPYETALPGPYIYDMSGELVWSGSNGSTTVISHDLHVCSYAESDHLCFFQGAQIGGYARGLSVFLDNEYKPAATVQSGRGLELSDMHELRIFDEDRVLITVYQPKQYDLVSSGIPAANGWVMSGVFQEINITSGEVLFQWSSLDHVPLSETYTPLGLNPAVGNGLSNTTPWDYFHINSVDKSSKGDCYNSECEETCSIQRSDYIVSSRHTSTIYKVSGKDGSLLWRLGGKESSFTWVDYNFSSQHDARLREENQTHTILSLFDNGSDNYRNTSSTSAGMILALDHRTNTSNILNRFEAPGKGLLSTSQGNTQMLPNGNVFIGWGENPSVSEHTADGSVVYIATLKDQNAMNYRAFKWNWTATPSVPPDVFAQASSPNAPFTFWASWNGATEYNSWNFYGSKSNSDPLVLLGSVTRQGFQTTFTFPQFYSHALAEAVSADGTGLRNSTIITVALPKASKK